MIQTCPSCQKRNRIPSHRLDQTARCGHCKQPISPLTSPVDINSAQEFDELISQSPLPVLVDFWAPWCGPCRAVAPELKKLAANSSGKIVVAKVDTESLPSLALRFKIQAVPSMILFKNGNESRRFAGAQSASSLSAQVGL